jgi:biopolymer transport protein TolR
MKRVSNQRQLRLVTEMNITPFLDLVLVLLFVFLLTAPLLKTDPQPAAAATPAFTAPDQQATLVVNRDQSITLNGAMLARANLPASLKQLAASRPGIGIEVRIHRDLPVQQLLETMKVLEKAGVQKTAVTTHADEP